MKTIGRNATCKIATLKASHTECKVHSLSGGFAGQSCEASYAWDELARFDFARLWDMGNHLVIRVHSNLWYELREPAS